MIELNSRYEPKEVEDRIYKYWQERNLFAARANPDLFPDLVVRVSGYSAYFKSLSPDLQQIVVDRMLTES